MASLVVAMSAVSSPPSPVRRRGRPPPAVPLPLSGARPRPSSPFPRSRHHFLESEHVSISECLIWKGTKTRSKQRPPSGMVGRFGRRLPLCFDRDMVTLSHLCSLGRKLLHRPTYLDLDLRLRSLDRLLDLRRR